MRRSDGPSPGRAFFRGLLTLVVVLGAGAAGAEPGETSAFRVRPYLQNPAPDAMTVRWFSAKPEGGRLRIDDRTLPSTAVPCPELDYQGPEPESFRHAATPFRHSVRVTGLSPATSYPYVVEQGGETVKAILTTSPEPGAVGKGGGVRLFFYADSETQPESRESRPEWLPSTSLPGGPRPRWVKGRYPVDETTGYRTNLALIAARAAESLRAGDPVLASVVGDLVAAGGEQRDWDEFWRHNAGEFGGLAARVPIVVAPGDNEMFGGPSSDDPLADLGGFSGPASLAASRKFLCYFEHPANGAADKRHAGRYHRVDFGPVTLLTIDTTNGGADGGPEDTNHLLDRRATPHIPDWAPGSEQHAWLERELAAAAERGAITFVQCHHPPFSSGRHGLPPGSGEGLDEHSGQPLKALAPLFKQHGVRAVFSGHDDLYEHSIADGVHYFVVGNGGDGLPPPQDGVVNERQIFIAHDHAPEQWKGNALAEGGKHYGHVEVDVRRAAGDGKGFTVTITPVHVMPVLSPDDPGEILSWERRTYDDTLTFDVEEPRPAAPADASPKPEPVP
jgi:hypothetical protein